MIELILAYILSSYIHTAGHFNEANNLNTPMSLKGTNEYYDASKLNLAEIDRINGAGFKHQDLISQTLQGSKYESQIKAANGFYKLFYLVGLPRAMGSKPSQDGINGDDGYLSARHGELGTKGAILLSAIGNIWKSQHSESLWDVNFDQSTSGVPMVRIDKRF